MANEKLRSIKVSREPVFGSKRIDYWAAEVTNAINGLPFSLFSTSGGPNASNFTAPEGFIGIEIGSSATKHWLKTTGSDGTGWSAIGVGVGTISSGTWLPTLTNVTNLSASSAYVGQWLRVGNVATGSGRVDVDPTGAGTVELGISLPVASNLAADEQLAGVAHAPAVADMSAAARADVANNRATLEWVAVDTSSRGMFFTFTYQVI